MKAPNLKRIIETFILIPIYDDESNWIQVWQDYLDLLRFKIAPLIKQLINKEIIDWYSFLIHHRVSGVPTREDDHGLYVHLRMALTESSTEAEIKNLLPSWCKWTRKMKFHQPFSLDNANIQILKNGELEQGWKILGESSEWVLNMLDSHEPSSKIPVQNVAQFLHYLGNQLFVKAVKISMP